MSVTYRDAVAGDAQALADFWRETFTATFGALYPVADLKRFIAESYVRAAVAGELADGENSHRLAVEGETIVGASKLGAFKLPHEADVAHPLELHRLYVVAAAKGTGVADALMAWTKTRARAQGAEALYLGVYQGNERAQRFYARHGFSIVGEYLFEVGETRDPEYIMRCALA
ncbi:MAG: GNAT family N-acetyltransferase [Hyphomonadaceae bacterium]|nr:GNAT family N-acetyltransferase [Hyphomonadaceae bacterium]